MKVDLEKITLGHSPLTGNIHAGTIMKPGVWRNKVDVTTAFIDCVIAKWGNKKQVLEDAEGYKYEISVKIVRPKDSKNKKLNQKYSLTKR